MKSGFNVPITVVKFQLVRPVASLSWKQYSAAYVIFIYFYLNYPWRTRDWKDRLISQPLLMAEVCGFT